MLRSRDRRSRSFFAVRPRKGMGVEVGDGRDALEVVAADADGIEIEVEVDGLPVVLR